MFFTQLKEWTFNMRKRRMIWEDIFNLPDNDIVAWLDEYPEWSKSRHKTCVKK